MPPSNERWTGWLHALWGRPAGLTWLEAGDARPVLVGHGGDRMLYLPANGLDVALAATAHAGAHWRFGGAPQPRRGLKPVQQALFEVLEDARVEALALREMPGLRALWLPFHADPDAPAGNGFEALLARLSRVLLDPAWDDPHPWVVKARMAFDPSLPVREVASRLGNDIGQMRLPFNAPTWRMHAAYRDDGSCLWEPEAQAPDSDLELAADASPPEGTPADAVPEPASPPVLYPEWDERIARYRRDWCHVFSSTAPSAAVRLQPVPPGDRRRLARALRSLRGGAPRPAGRASWGDEFHPMALLDARLQMRAGQTPDNHIYRRRIAVPQPLAVQLLLDASASTADRCNDGRPLLAHMRDAALACAAAFEELGHRSALAAFASRTRHRVDWQQLKQWDEAAAAPAVLARAAGLRSGGSTRLGAAVRHAVAQVLSRKCCRAWTAARDPSCCCSATAKPMTSMRPTRPTCGATCAAPSRRRRRPASPCAASPCCGIAARSRACCRACWRPDAAALPTMGA
ncbi:hypothetical protein HK414_00790 [Ramlibacter terrae]|uniref:Uncharacterized protein n=1 Tax=Ramlibacter terrae TaxID=2732511 RepID=A0ABX6P0W0_9BURK|nr:hypothetical protein HK414_00790 [Ramlibacter terrae]